MTDKTLYWATMVFASLALLLFLGNVSLVRGNMKIQETIAVKQKTIGIAERVLPIHQQLSQALYELSVKNNDLKLRDLLTAQGIELPQAPAKAETASESKAPVKAAPKAKKDEE